MPADVYGESLLADARAILANESPPERLIEVRDTGRWFAVRTFPYCTTTGVVTGVVITFMDVTELKRAEDDLLIENANLRAGDRAKDEFLAVLSHELRNPLAPIRNSLHILDRSASNGEPAQRAIAVIGRQVAQLTRLVDDLLDVARINRGKIQIRRIPLELATLLQRTVEDHRSEFTASGLRIETHLPQMRLWVNADASRIAQAVGNLLHNAAKFTDRGGVVTLSLAEDGARTEAVVRVRDTGIGIDPPMFARLFDPFTQADRSRSRSKGGLGLGLALVRRFAELHGGSVEAHSEGLGAGAEFVLRLPLCQKPETLEPADPKRSPAGERRRVLIIENDVDTADSLREVLELGQHKVEVAYTGSDGIDKARASKPDVVLCDIGLPGMGGYEVARALRADETLKGTFLVALSGYAMSEDLQRAAEAGFDRHLAKPPRLEELDELVGIGGSTS